MLRKAFGSKREVTGNWSAWHNEEPRDLHCPPNILLAKSTRRRWAGYVAPMGDRSGAYKVLVGIPEEKRPPGRPRRRWEENMKMDLLQECDGATWTGFTWIRIETYGGLL